jgi:hypothetical protein
MPGDQLAVPDIRSAADLRIAAKIAFSIPAIGDPEGWRVHFGRELNATDDRHHFSSGGAGLPVIEGKHLRPFGVELPSAEDGARIPARIAARLLDPPRTFRRARLGYREVAAATNRLTLIAAIIPADVVTTHTIFCIKETIAETAQHYLCGMFNSFVANYLVRMRVGTHVTAAIIDRLPVPRPPLGSRAYLRLAALSRRLRRRDTAADRARLQALAARLYEVTEDEFAHVLGTFPLVPEADRAAALSAFRYIVT